MGNKFKDGILAFKEIMAVMIGVIYLIFFLITRFIFIAIISLVPAWFLDWVLFLITGLNFFIIIYPIIIIYIIVKIFKTK